MATTLQDSTNDNDNEQDTDTTTKDKDKDSSDAQQPGRIKKLSNDVVNRIAAGEVIQRPANAVKEMIENCIDARATNINVIVKNGGLKSLQIQDNGHGIKKEDLDIVCERFTTSKLRAYEDLKSITTYGFRGEALASVSHVAHVTITSMTQDSPCAYKAVYSDGKLIAARPGESAAPKSCAGVKGTQILVEDLFYNVPTRRKAIKNASEEHQHIVSVMTKYAIHNSGISFSCKKHGESTTDVHTTVNNTTEDNIRLLYGQAVARELVHVTLKDDTDLNFKMNGHVTNANYNMKKMAFILFINHRLVESKPLKTALDSVYAKYLPKGTHPFVYISLEIAPQNVDVNVHPTKQEVRFLHEDRIIESIQKLIEDKLLDQNKSRTFYTQSLLPGAGSSSSVGTPKKTGDSTPSKAPRPDQMVRTDSRNQDLTGFLTKTTSSTTTTTTTTSSTPNKNKINPPSDLPTDDPDDDFMSTDKNTVTDTRYDDVQNGGDGVYDADNDFVDTAPSSSSKSPKSTTKTSSPSFSSTPKHKGNAIVNSVSHAISSASKSTKNNNNNNNTYNANANTSNNNNNAATGQTKRSADEIEATGHIQKKARNRKHRTCELTSIQSMVSGFQKNAHEGLLDLFKNHIFVGCVDRTFVLVQYRTKLYLLNTVTLSKELVYQEIFQRFGDFDRIKLATPIPLHTLILIALESPLAGWVEANGEKETIAKKLTADLLSRSEMLREYLALEIDADGNLCTLPQVLDDYIPQLKYLPLFILWLCTDVEWDYEVECFEGIARQLADFYCVQPETIYTNDPKPPSTYPSAMVTNDDTDPGGHSAEWVLQHLVFPALRRNFYPPKGFSNDGTIIQIAQLENLYKIFERC